MASFTLSVCECSTFSFKTGILKLNPLSINPTKWSNTLKQFVGNLPNNCLSVFDHFANLTFKGLNRQKLPRGMFFVKSYTQMFMMRNLFLEIKKTQNT